MLRGVFDLDEHTARDAMIPRTEVDAVDISATVADILALYKEDLRERYPVYETSVDNIIGVVSMKELLNRIASSDHAETSMDIADLPVREVMMPAYYVPDTMPLSSLLDDFTGNRRQIAIVLDEYGGTEGLITLEDILEEIVGDYEDEFTPRHRHIKKEDHHSYVINGGVRVTELEPKLNYPFPTGDYVTLGGLIYHRLGRIATVGDVLELEGARLEVMEMDNHRITKVLFQEIVPQATDEDAADGPPAADNSPGEFRQPLGSGRAIPGGKPPAAPGPAGTGGDKVVEFEKGGFDTKRNTRT
jgi:putative hemolysin